MLDSFERAQFVSLLAWYSELGIDAVLDEQPIDWSSRPGTGPGDAVRANLRGSASSMADRSVSAPPRITAPEQGSSSRAPVVNDPVAQPAAAPLRRASQPRTPGASSARAAASAANSLAELRSALERFEGCALKATAKNTCVYRGAERAPLMIIGEAPGRDEDLEGRPFVGRAGQLLDRMLAAIDLGEADVHITNIVYWRPPGNRTPTPQEAETCRPFLERQIRLVEPRMILVLGGAAAKSMLGASEGIMRLRGKWKQTEVGGMSIPILPSLHPAYLLRTPAAKRQAWRDLLSVREALVAAR